MQALDKLTWDENKKAYSHKDIKLTILTREASEIGDVRLTTKQVEKQCRKLKFKIISAHGTKYVRFNPVILGQLQDL